MNSDNNYMNIQNGDIINDKKRGDILYYSINQVATLLDQEDSSIRYYTNIFDNILKIEISDKELRYTNKDIDKLEFLINLKNKGMTIKEVQKYCEKLPLDIEELIEVKENTSLSAKEIISTIIELENQQINKFKECLSNEFNILPTQKTLETMEEKQNEQLNSFKDNILNEIKEYIDYKLDIESKMNKDLYNELSLKIDNLISEQLSLENNIKLQFDNFNEITVSRDLNLINEIKKFENVIERAYYVQQDIDTQKKNLSFIEKIFGSR